MSVISPGQARHLRRLARRSLFLTPNAFLRHAQANGVRATTIDDIPDVEFNALLWVLWGATLHPDWEPPPWMG